MKFMRDNLSTNNCGSPCFPTYSNQRKNCPCVCLAASRADHQLVMLHHTWLGVLLTNECMYVLIATIQISAYINTSLCDMLYKPDHMKVAIHSIPTQLWMYNTLRILYPECLESQEFQISHLPGSRNMCKHLYSQWWDDTLE